MGYLPKELIYKSYITLSSLTEDHRQGQTQFTSALRHLLALDMFYKKYEVNCDLDSPKNRELFTENVKEIVNVKDDFYTTNFYTNIKELEDCGVGSNFYSAGVVNNSKQNTSYTYDYPTRGQYPLFKVRDNVLIREVSYYKNIKGYLKNQDLKSAFVIWILRNKSVNQLDATFLMQRLFSIFTEELVMAMVPKEEKLNEYVAGFELNQNKSELTTNELLELFSASKGRANTVFNDNYRPYITAIKSKPFLLLAGISGTGKTRIVRELARACWEEGSEEFKAQKPRNFEMVQVKPNWHDSSELIGYVSRIDGVRYVVGPFLRFMVKAILDPDTPYFLCLDEMNLAPVEQYFAEYLSVVESRKRQDDGTIATDPIIDYSNTEEYVSLIQQLFSDDDDLREEYQTGKGGKRLTIPNNLIVVGTVNMDETTFSFSRKVLDRAMTIEMNEVDLAGGLDSHHEKIGKLGAAELIGTAVEGVDVYSNYKGVCDTAIAYLQQINNVLEGTPFKIAYRTRNEVLLYVVNNLPYKQEGETEDYVINRALDEITNMKILSRIEGDADKIGNLLERLTTVIKELLGEQFTIENSVSLKKLDEMERKLKSGYTSFWS